MSEVTTIGLDIAKHVFHAHGADERGGTVFSRRLTRGKLLDFFARHPRCVVALEACGGAHHWARELRAMGHEVRLIPPAYVKPFVKRHKNDAVDAEAICEAAQRPSMRFVAVTVSYQVDLNRVAQKVPGMPLVELRLDGAGTDAHWSEVKQIALGKQFLDTLIDLQNRGVATVHLFLAAPSSMVLRLGRLYDIRNLPALIVYQFEPNGPPFPWGVKMPVQGNPDAQIV